jgi:hypothetical protein
MKSGGKSKGEGGGGGRPKKTKKAGGMTKGKKRRPKRMDKDWIQGRYTYTDY